LRPKVVREIDRDSLTITKTTAEKNAEAELVRRITRGINGGDTGLDDRIKYTRLLKDILL